MTDTRKRNVLLDFGYVLTGAQDASVFDPVLVELGLKRDAFLGAWGLHRAAYDCGSLDARAYWSLVLGDAGATGAAPWLDGNLDRLGRTDLAAWSRPRRVMHDLVARLVDAGVPVGILSNMPAGAGRLWMDLWPALDRVAFKLWSGDEGVSKPDPAIYKLFIKRSGWLPEDTLFVDDVERNIDAARALGFKVHLFRTEDAAAKAVSAWARLPQA